MPGVDLPLDKYTILVSLLNIGPFLVRSITFQRERAARQAKGAQEAPVAVRSAGGILLPTRPPRRFAAYPLLTTVGVLAVLAYAGTTLGVREYARLNPPPVDLHRFTLPPYIPIVLLVWGLTCLLGIGCALFAVVRSIRLRRWEWPLALAGLLLGILVVIESGNDRIGDTFFSILIFGPASAIIFGLFGPPNPTDWSR